VSAWARYGQPLQSQGFMMGRMPFRLRPVLSRVLHADRNAPRAAREALDDLDTELDPELKGDLRLLVSEIVTNSVMHAQPQAPGDLTLDVWASDEVVRVAVSDHGAGFVAAEQPRSDGRSGWGLMMVDQISDRWGVDLDDGTEVWFEFERPHGDGGDHRNRSLVAS
jgi:anti-sigma regulatory factor (Ser/Thr protein kinase)